jgi:hypothetical protein
LYACSIALELENLDDTTREYMLAELDLDEGPPDRVHISPRLSDAGRGRYRVILRESLANGGMISLEAALSAPGMFNAYEMSSRKGVAYSKQVPYNAAESLAEGEFNRYYIRGLCARLVAEGGGEVQVYRARFSNRPRPGSQEMIGLLIEPAALLEDLRLHIGETPTLLPHVNSGLSVRIA